MWANTGWTTAAVDSVVVGIVKFPDVSIGATATATVVVVGAVKTYASWPTGFATTSKVAVEVNGEFGTLFNPPAVVSIANPRMLVLNAPFNPNSPAGVTNMNFPVASIER